MARRQSEPEEEGSWMDTYGDMVTLLLTFFVLLFSMSSMDESREQIVIASLSGQPVEVIAQIIAEKTNNQKEDTTLSIFEPEATMQDDEFDKFFEYLYDVIAKTGNKDNIEINQSPIGIHLKFKDKVFFAPDSFKLLESGQDVLAEICGGLMNVDDKIMAIRVSGHTAQALTSNSNEWELSSGRADSVVNYLISLNVSDSSKYSAVGYGKYRPVSDNNTTEGRNKNRRVEIVFIRNDVDFTDSKVVDELFKLEFGTDFVRNVDSEGQDLESEISDDAGDALDSLLE